MCMEEQTKACEVMVFSVSFCISGIGIYLDVSSVEQIKCTVYVNYPRIWPWTLHR
jgi:hypothetical protein